MNNNPFSNLFNRGVSTTSTTTTTVKNIEIYKTSYLYSTKILLVCVSIAFIIFGLYMIDESCGCVRAQDKLMPLMLKIHVLASILLLISAFTFSKNRPIISIITVLIFLGAILGIDSWIFYRYRNCLGKGVEGSDKRFLSWIIASIVLSASLLLATIVGLGVIIHRFRKNSTFYYLDQETKNITKDYNRLVRTLNSKMEREKINFNTYINGNNLRKYIENETGKEIIATLDIKDNIDTKLPLIEAEIKQIIKTYSEKYTKYEQLLNSITKDGDTLKYKIAELNKTCSERNVDMSKCTTAQRETKKLIIDNNTAISKIDAHIARKQENNRQIVQDYNWEQKIK